MIYSANPPDKPTQLSVHWLLGTSAQRERRTGREAKQYIAYRFEVKNEYN